MLRIVKPCFTFTITGEPDTNYRIYLARKVREQHTNFVYAAHNPEAQSLDISLDDTEGDVMAGIAAVTVRNTLYIDMLWVHMTLQRRGIGKRLINMAENIALERGCVHARICIAHDVDYYLKTGYQVCGRLQQFPHGETIYWLYKDLVNLGAINQKGPA